MVEALIFIVGLAVGSFANVLIDRLPAGESVIKGRSKCDFCKKTLRFWELVPVFSYVFLHGRCRRCHRALSIQYPLIELLVAGMFVGLYWLLGFSPVSFVLLSSIFVSLLVIFAADCKYQIIPDAMVVVGVISAGLYGVLRVPMAQFFTTYVISAIAAFLFFYALWAVTKGRGMGFGDVKFAFFMGLFLGFPSIIVALYVAFLTGAGVGVILILMRSKTLKSKIAFGPFLVFGTVIAYFWGGSIISWWYLLW